MALWMFRLIGKIPGWVDVDGEGQISLIGDNH